jgi:hypothetical protein
MSQNGKDQQPGSSAVLSTGKVNVFTVVYSRNLNWLIQNMVTFKLQIILA